MKRYTLMPIAVGLLCVSLLACRQTPPTDVERTLPQSTVEVRSQTQTLDLKPLSSGANFGQQDNTALINAFERKQSDVFVEGRGTVKKLLPDDNKGARHQKFLVTISDQQTLLFAHNIDLAERIDTIAVGDEIQFRGEYVYNPKGGVMHWMHRDPQGRQTGGWIQHHGKTYQ